MTITTKLTAAPSAFVGSTCGYAGGIGIKKAVRIHESNKAVDNYKEKWIAYVKKTREESKDICESSPDKSVGKAYKGNLLCKKEETAGKTKLETGNKNKKTTKFTIPPLGEGMTITVEDLQDRCKTYYSFTNGKNADNSVGEEVGKYCGKTETKPSDGTSKAL